MFCILRNQKIIIGLDSFSNQYYFGPFWIIKVFVSTILLKDINEKGDGAYRGFGYLSLFSDPIDLATWSQRESLNFFAYRYKA